MSKAYEKIQRINEQMKHVPQLPKDFASWVRTKAMIEFKYIFYKKLGKVVHGVCSSCKEKVKPDNAAHNQIGKCPNCRAEVMFKAIHKAKTYQDEKIVSIMQKMTDGNYVIRYFKILMTFKDGEAGDFPKVVLPTLLEPELHYREGSREIITIFKNGNVRWNKYEWLYHYMFEREVWRPERGRSAMFNKELYRYSRPMIYKRNLKRLLKKTNWKYSALDQLKLKHMNMGCYLRAYENNPSLEILVKMDAKKLLYEIVEFEWHPYGMPGNFKSSTHLYGIKKHVLKRAVELNLNAHDMFVVSKLEKANIRVDDKKLAWILQNDKFDNFIGLCKYTTPHKIIKYVDRINKLEDSISETSVIGIWRDYIDDCIKLDFDLKKDYFLFPNNLHERHAEYTQMIENKVQKEINEGVIAAAKKWASLEYAEGDFKIEIAKDQEMIIQEGSDLGHCVGSQRYTRAMANGKIVILMLRKLEQPNSS